MMTFSQLNMKRQIWDIFVFKVNMDQLTFNAKSSSRKEMRESFENITSYDWSFEWTFGEEDYRRQNYLIPDLSDSKSCGQPKKSNKSYETIQTRYRAVGDQRNWFDQFLLSDVANNMIERSKCMDSATVLYLYCRRFGIVHHLKLSIN
jgi:hypothetical protein